MARRLAAFALRVALTLLAAAATVLVLRPEWRNAVIAEFNDPTNLPALDSDARIHFEPKARSCAEEVAKVLPAAMAKIEAEHGRPFRKEPVVAVYASLDAYARANALGDPDVAAVSRAGRAILSPVLCAFERYRLASVLTHELSHVHFFGWRGRRNRPPQWFTEGLAVMASDGGAAESVSDAQAGEAIQSGYAVRLDNTPWTDFAAIPFVSEPPCPAGCDRRSFRQRLAYRQASIFLAWLRRTNGNAFSRLMRALEGGAAFDPAFVATFGGSPPARWRDFAESLHASR